MRAWRGLPALYFAALSVVLLRTPLSQPGMLTFDDLIPFMHLDQIADFMFSPWNDYYQWPELRGRYSLLWQALRYVDWMPFAYWAVSVAVGLGAYGLVAHVAARVFPQPVRMRGPALLAGTVYLVLIFSTKAQQLQSLYLGAAFLPIAVHALLKSFDEAGRWRWRWALVAAGLLLVNPSIHLVLLGFGAMAALALAPLAKRQLAGLKSVGLVVAFGLGPYLGWMASGTLSPTTAATASVPLGLLQAWSAPFWERLLLPVGLSLTETQAAGKYVFAHDLFLRFPLESLLFLVIPLGAFFGGWAGRGRPLVWGTLGLWLFSVWMSTGVAHGVSGYAALIALAQGTTPLAGPAGLVLSVLRNPDRWLFVAAMCAVVLLGVGLTRLSGWVAGTRWEVRLGTALVVAGVVLGPFVLHPAMVGVWSGDLGGILRPAVLPDAYREGLAVVGRNKTLYLPLLGTRPLSWNHGKKTQDEPFALLHGGPSMEGATGSPLSSQEYLGYAYFELLYHRKTRNLGRYLSAAGIRYVFFHDLDVGEPFVPDEFDRVRGALNDQSDLKLVFHRENVYVYENQALAPAAALERLSGVVVHLGSWGEAVEALGLDVTPRKVAWLEAEEGEVDLGALQRALALDPARVVVYAPTGAEGLAHLLMLKGAGVVAYPDPGWDAAAMDWTTQRELNTHVLNLFRFQDRFGLFGPERAYGQRLAATEIQGAAFPFHWRVTAEGVYDVYARVAAPMGARIQASLDANGYAKTVQIEPSPTYRFVRLDTLHLMSGSYDMTLTNLSNVPLVVNLIHVVSQPEQAAFIQKIGPILGAVEVVSSPQALGQRVIGWGTAPAAPLWGYARQAYWGRRWLVGAQAELAPLRSWWVASVYEGTYDQQTPSWVLRGGPADERDDLQGTDRSP